MARVKLMKDSERVTVKMARVKLKPEEKRQTVAFTLPAGEVEKLDKIVAKENNKVIAKVTRAAFLEAIVTNIIKEQEANKKAAL